MDERRLRIRNLVTALGHGDYAIADRAIVQAAAEITGLTYEVAMTASLELTRGLPMTAILLRRYAELAK